MNKTPACYLFLGLLMGAIIGAAIGAANGNTIPGMQIGAASGLFIGWILTAPALQK